MAEEIEPVKASCAVGDAASSASVCEAGQAKGDALHGRVFAKSWRETGLFAFTVVGRIGVQSVAAVEDAGASEHIAEIRRIAWACCDAKICRIVSESTGGTLLHA